MTNETQTTKTEAARETAQIGQSPINRYNILLDLEEINESLNIADKEKDIKLAKISRNISQIRIYELCDKLRKGYRYTTYITLKDAREKKIRDSIKLKYNQRL